MSDVKTVLRAADAATLKKLFVANFPQEIIIPDEKDQIKKLANHVDALGLRSLVQNLKATELEDIADGLKIDLGDKKHHSKNFLSKRITERLADEGTKMSETLAKLSSGVQEPILEVLDITSGTASGNASSIAKAIKSNGLSIMLSVLNQPALAHIAESMKLKMKTDTQSSLLEAITTGKPPAKRESNLPAKTKPSTKKPELSGTISPVDIHQHYYLEDLQEFCKKNGIPSSGKKSVLGKRIIEYFNTDEDEEKPTKKAKTTKASEKKGAKKAKTTKKSGEKKSEEKEKKSEEKEKKSEEKKKGEDKKKKGDEEKSEEKETPSKKGKKSPEKVTEKASEKESEKSEEKDTPSKKGKKSKKN